MGIYKANSIKELLGKDILNNIMENIIDMKIYNISTTGLSGSKMYKLELKNIDEIKVLYLKVNNLKEDWLAKVSNDKGRELTIFKDGIYTKLEDFIKDVYIAYYECEYSYAILMNDMSQFVGANVNSDDYYAYLDNLASFHAKFKEHDIMNYKSLLSVEEYYYFLTEEKINNVEELKEGNSNGWSRIKKFLGEELYEKYCNHTRIDSKFSYYPKTFLHGDYRPDNALYVSKDDVRFIDWANSGCGPCTLDLLWYIMSSVDYKVDKIDLIYYYKERLESYLGYKFTQRTWETLLRVGILCSCRMFLAPLMSGSDLNDKLALDNIYWWVENLKLVLNDID